MSGFKIPESVPQDLLLIQEMVDIPPPAPKFVQKMDEESSSGDISSSDSEDEGENSEDEIEANLVMADNDDSDPAPEKNVYVIRLSSRVYPVVLIRTAQNLRTQTRILARTLSQKTIPKNLGMLQFRMVWTMTRKVPR